MAAVKHNEIRKKVKMATDLIKANPRATNVEINDTLKKFFPPYGLSSGVFQAIRSGVPGTRPLRKGATIKVGKGIQEAASAILKRYIKAPEETKIIASTETVLDDEPGFVDPSITPALFSPPKSLEEVVANIDAREAMAKAPGATAAAVVAAQALEEMKAVKREPITGRFELSVGGFTLLGEGDLNQLPAAISALASVKEVVSI